MGDFGIYCSMGIEHITDLDGSDHILFIAALCIRYLWSDWKKLLILVTAFTIGHSVTLALSTFSIINVPLSLTEFFIALTIIFTAIDNLWVKKFQFSKKYPVIYFLALFFGLIHGLGFSTLLKSMLGKDQNIIPQLFAFNIGLELGQLMIVAMLMLVSFIFVGLLRSNRRDFIVFASGAVTALALTMALERWPW